MCLTCAMVVTLCRHHPSLLTGLALLALCLLSYRLYHEDSQLQGNLDAYTASMKKLKFNKPSESDMEFIQKEIKDQEENIESMRRRVDEIKEELLDVNSRQKRALESDLTKCPTRSPHLLGSVLINEVRRGEFFFIIDYISLEK